MKLKSLFIFSLIIFSFISWRFIYAGGGSDVDSGALQIRMRNIGHQLLLKAGDTSSRVLPIKKISESNFQILFESQLTLEPDTLVGIVNNSLRGLDFAEGYLVNVHNCITEEIVYGFEIQQGDKTDVIPCLGRSLPMACYEINVVFQQPPASNNGYSYLAASFLACIVLGFMVLKRSNQNPESKKDIALEFISLGDFQFFHEKQLIRWRQQEILLTVKENQVLRIFARSPNEIIDRDRLQKEVWENEGVVVGRSLDVFISKLRKKLEIDPSVRIVNIHGKGYKLEID